jgi:hypothetical protein
VRKQRWVLVLAAAGSFMVSLDALVVTTALPTIRNQLGASLSSLECGTEGARVTALVKQAVS